MEKKNGKGNTVNRGKKEILKPKREANEVEKRNMLGKAIEVLIVATTTNHVYKFGNKYRVQAKGEGKSDEKVTMEIIRDIAETIDPMIKLTIDTP